MTDTVELVIPTLGNRFIDYRKDILGDSYTFGPVIRADQVKYFCFHHSVTPQTAKNDGDWKKECDRIASEHVNGNGWAGVGYRFIICSNGIVAYVGDLSHGGAAIRGHNDIVFSACMVGDFTKELPTDKQIQSAHDLADWFINNMPQYPLINSWDNSVIGHKDAKDIFQDPSLATACPGSSWPNDLKWRIQTNTIYTPISQPPVPPTPNPLPPHSGTGIGPGPIVDLKDEEIKKLKIEVEKQKQIVIALQIEKDTQLANAQKECQTKIATFKTKLQDIINSQ